jgi:pimeloyl-ACP methyl ester carboxylesterase
MSLISTTSFELAAYVQGDSSADKLALVLPGLLETKDYAHMRSHVDCLAGLGYLAVSFDPPGTWESPGDIADYTVTNYLQSIDELIGHFGERPTFLMGHSRGATAAISAGCTNPHVRAFAPVMPAYIDGAYQGKIDEVWKRTGVRMLERDPPPGDVSGRKVFALPYSFFVDQIEHDITDELSRCEKPKLFIYGTQDPGATRETVGGFYDIAAAPKQLSAIESGHSYRRNEAAIEAVNALVRAFLLEDRSYK